MSRRRGRLERVGRVAQPGIDIVQRRVAVYVGLAAAAVAGGLALLGCLIAALVGDGPSLGNGALIVIVAALLAGLIARALVNRLTVAAVAAFVARRVARRGGRRR